eukprot:COSAG03_NODE_2539_length_2662_cov_81.957082_2_plen_106_part_00
MTTHKYNQIDVSKLSLGKIKDGAKMRTFFIDYDKQLFSVQSPQLLLDWGGIPKVDEYHTTDAERRYVLYGLGPQPQSKTHETDAEHAKRKQELEDFDSWLHSLED